MSPPTIPPRVTPEKALPSSKSHVRTVLTKQRSLLAAITSSAALISDVFDPSFSNLRRANNNLFSLGYDPAASSDSLTPGQNRTVMKADAANLQGLAAPAARQLDRANLRKRYSTTELTEALRKSYKRKGGRGFDWVTLGRNAGACFNTVPRVQFLAGSLGEEVEEGVVGKSRKRRRRVDEEEEEVQPEVVKAGGGNAAGSGVQVMEIVVRSVASTLKKASEKASPPGGGACALALVASSGGFAESVENLLALSFLVSAGKASLKLSGERLPVARTVWEAERAKGGEKRQCIAAISYREWREVEKAFGTEGGVPTRGGGEGREEEGEEEEEEEEEEEKEKEERGGRGRGRGEEGGRKEARKEARKEERKEKREDKRKENRWEERKEGREEETEDGTEGNDSEEDGGSRPPPIPLPPSSGLSQRRLFPPSLSPDCSLLSLPSPDRKRKESYESYESYESEESVYADE